jgi:hypothetical protein
VRALLSAFGSFGDDDGAEVPLAELEAERARAEDALAWLSRRVKSPQHSYMTTLVRRRLDEVAAEIVRHS